MNKTLTETEQQALARLRKADAQWPTHRWLLLALGIFNIASGASSYFRHNDHAFGLLAVTVGLAVIVFAARDWRGNATRQLLLKLYDAA